LHQQVAGSLPLLLLVGRPRDTEFTCHAPLGKQRHLAQQQLGDPKTMNDDPQYTDVALDVFDVLEARISACEAAGIPRAKLVADPGIGFGKHLHHNVAVLANPFLGTRGIRLSLRHPEVFRVQLRAMARAAVHGSVRIMLPMVTVPGEIDQAAVLLDAAVADLESEGSDCRRPPLGIMVEVPAVAIVPEVFARANFFSIGSNDLTQYVTASARDIAAVSDLNDPGHPAVVSLIRNVVHEGARPDRDVSLCGDMGGDPKHLPALIAAGLRSVSVAPPLVGRAKRAIAAIEAGGR
jgi:phosphoenolpyruvate-protein kinase (PTS system EI component)